MNPIVPEVQLPDASRIPAIGFGVYRMDSETCEKTVLEALNAGYRFIDTAALYGNEEAVGRAIKSSGIARDQLFISTKLWLQDTTYDRAKPAFHASLDRLGLDYVDLYVIHQPYNDLYGAWRALAELQASGLIRTIGIDNFDSARLADFVAFNDVAPAVNFLEVNPFCQQTYEIDFMRAKGVQPLAWSPLGAGNASILSDPTIVDIAHAHEKTSAQIILRWLVQRDIIPVVKSSNPHRIRENIDIFDFSLSESDMNRISLLDTGIGMVDPRKHGHHVEVFLRTALEKHGA